jgi:hypothetical protein
VVESPGRAAPQPQGSFLTAAPSRRALYHRLLKARSTARHYIVAFAGPMMMPTSTLRRKSCLRSFHVRQRWYRATRVSSDGHRGEEVWACLEMFVELDTCPARASNRANVALRR